MVITGGTVEFSRTVKPADYESKGARVVLSFGVDEGEDTQGVLERVSAIAMRHALSMVGERVAAKYVEETPLPVNRAMEILKDVVVEKPKRQARKPVDPAAIEGVSTHVEGVVEENPTLLAAAPDPAAIEDIEEAPVEAPSIVISDKDLATACANAREEKGAKYDVRAVRKLIGEYAAPGIRMSEIPKDKRQAFLDALKAL